MCIFKGTYQRVCKFDSILLCSSRPQLASVHFCKVGLLNLDYVVYCITDCTFQCYLPSRGIVVKHTLVLGDSLHFHTTIETSVLLTSIFFFFKFRSFQLHHTAFISPDGGCSVVIAVFVVMVDQELLFMLSYHSSLFVMNSKLRLSCLSLHLPYGRDYAIDLLISLLAEKQIRVKSKFL